MMLTRHQVDYLVLHAQQIVCSEADARHKETAELILKVAERVEKFYHVSLGEWLSPRTPLINVDAGSASNDKVT